MSKTKVINTIDAHSHSVVCCEPVERTVMNNKSISISMLSLLIGSGALTASVPSSFAGEPAQYGTEIQSEVQPEVQIDIESDAAPIRPGALPPKVIEQLMANCNTSNENAVTVHGCIPADGKKELSLAHRLTAAGTVLAIYGGIGTWSYFAWYSKQTHGPFHVENEGWFGPETYAGGTDKLGRAFSNYVMSRWTAQLLQETGMKKLPSALLANTLTLMFFTGIELKDGFHKGYGFSWGDMIANVAGNVLATVMIEFPKVDEMFDYRLEYFPSAAYRKKSAEGDPNVGEDYSGMHYGLWYHLSSNRAVTENTNPLIRMMKYLDVGLGYHTENFKPEPTDPTTKQKQQVFFGITADLQKVADDLFFHGGQKQTAGRTATQAFTEFFTLPFTAAHIGPSFESDQNTRY